MLGRRRKILQGLVLLFWTITAIAISVAAIATAFADAAYSQAEHSLTAADSDPIRHLHEAIALRPDWATPRRTLAEQLSLTDLDAALRSSTAAVTLEPDDWKNWNTLGMIQFQRGNLNAAKAALHTSARLNHGFQSYFESANLELLLGEPDRYWDDLRQALALATLHDAQYVLNQVLIHPPKDPKLLQKLFPLDRPRLLLGIVGYFLDHHETANAISAWSNLNCPGYLNNSCGMTARRLTTVLLENGLTANPASSRDAQLAIGIWNHAVRQKWVNQPDSSEGQISNGLFTHPLNGPAFSWSMLSPIPQQILPQRTGPGNQFILHFDGTESESIPLFYQLVPVLTNASYQLTYDTRRMGDTNNNGIGLTVNACHERIANQLAKLESAWQTNTVLIKVPASCNVLDVKFVYQRPTGQTTLNDTIAFRDIALKTAQQ